MGMAGWGGGGGEGGGGCRREPPQVQILVQFNCY